MERCGPICPGSQYYFAKPDPPALFPGRALQCNQTENAPTTRSGVPLSAVPWLHASGCMAGGNVSTASILLSTHGSTARRCTVQKSQPTSTVAIYHGKLRLLYVSVHADFPSATGPPTP